MQLNGEDQRFLAKRARLVKTWRYAGAILIAMLIGLGIWLFFSKPLLANPFVVLTRLKSDSIPESTMALMAGILPVVVLMCIFLAITIVLFAFLAFSNEKKYLTLIQRESNDIRFAQPKQ
jgi:ABC-type transport system involved in multi-copper enzyme maturation permease subunit